MKVLQVISSLDNGGVENLMYGYCSRIKGDFQFDFTTFDTKTGALEERFASIGNVIRITQMRSNIWKTFAETKRCIKNGNYDVIHIHQGYLGFIALHYARKYKVNKVVLHSHVAYVPEGIVKKIVRKVLTNYCLTRTNYFMACSIDAAEWMWGKETTCRILKNAVQTSKFDYNVLVRKTKREELGLENKYVVGCVGRICYQKNPEFTLRIFKEFLRMDPDAILLMVGNGDQEKEMVDLAEKLEISSFVKFLGTRNDVPELLSAMDVFLLPSRFEGLGIAYVEAQINGLKCYASLEGVPKEAQICDEMYFVSLDENPDIWAKMICDTKNEVTARVGRIKEAIDAGYDIDSEADNLANYYLSL